MSSIAHATPPRLFTISSRECHMPLSLSRPIDEPLYTKPVHSAFIGTSLEADLRVHDIILLFMCGLTSNMCVNMTVRMAENLGFEVFVVEDVCATLDRVGPDGVRRRAEDVHAYAMLDFCGEFCTVVKASDVQGLLGN
ncbi:Isochorismatase-like protein [Pisolithus sp. B1]|nr:Isochorismatase-like protein [Pisolithus sp. B1]